MNYEHGDRSGMSGRNQGPHDQRPGPSRRLHEEDGRQRHGASSAAHPAGRKDVRRETAAGREDTNRRPAGQTGEIRQERVNGGSSGIRDGGQTRPSSSRSSGTRKMPSDLRLGENPREALAQARIARAKHKKRKRRIITMIVVECFTLMLIFGYGYLARRWNMMQREEFKPQDVQNNELSVEYRKEMQKGYRMIAIFGVDSRSTNVGAGVQSDVNIICCINEDTGEIKLVSLYRDTYLNINDSGSYRKFNAAYTNGGPEQALKALNRNLDLDITEYITFSWKAVAEGINILGGVDVDITRSEFKFINGFITETVNATGIGSHQLKGPGTHHLDGVQAVAYGRLRLMDTDYARTERQRKIIELAFAKAKQADFSALNNILVTILPNVSTNLTVSDMTSMALNIGKYHIGETAGFPFAKGNVTIPGKGDCVIPQTLESNVSQLHAFLFGNENYTPTERVKQISARVAEDSGMYREGKPSRGSALATDSYVPDETTKDREKETDTTEETDESESILQWETDEYGNPVLIYPGETDEYGNPVITYPRETDEYGNPVITYPGETDEYGNLIDGPIDNWPEDPDGEYPGGHTGTGPGGTGTTDPGGRLPVMPGGNGNTDNGNRTPGESDGNSQGPGWWSTEGDGSTQAGPGGVSQPGVTTNQGGTSQPGGTTNPGGSTQPGGTANPGGSTQPGGTTSPGGNTRPGGTGGTQPGDTGGPGSNTQSGGTGSQGGGEYPGNTGSSEDSHGPGVSNQPGDGQNDENQGPGSRISAEEDPGGPGQ